MLHLFNGMCSTPSKRIYYLYYFQEVLKWKFLMSNWIVMASSFVMIILFGTLILTSISMTNRFAYFMQQYDHSHIAKALAPKYPEVGLPSPK